MSSLKDLKTMGLKATLPRLRILSLFDSSLVRHLSADDVYKTLIGEMRILVLPPFIGC